MPENQKTSKKFKPSDFMRQKRPELYSDSTFTHAYKITKSVFNYHLSTITERNDHKLFEEFCRALAQREICRNLRPQTGPEGGGDGKVDTETYPVSEDVSESWYEGKANNDSERWAVAISAKKDWVPKVKKDVKSIIETERGYSRILFLQTKTQKRLSVSKLRMR